MESKLQLDSVRRLVLDTLAEMGMPTAKVEETTLLRDPVHPGRRFQYQSVRAVWFADAGHIEFFTEHGQFLKTVELRPHLTGRPVAA